MARQRDDKLRESIGIHEDLMDDIGRLADMFIGNDNFDDLDDRLGHRSLPMLIGEFHSTPNKEILKDELMAKINQIEEKLANLRIKVDANFKKARFIYDKI